MGACAVLFLGRGRGCGLSLPSLYPSILPDKLSLRRLPLGTGDGYVHSLPEFSHDRHGVPTPLFTHFTFERRQRMQAMLERIRLCVCLGDAGPAAWYVAPAGAEMVVVLLLVFGLAWSEWRSESASRTWSVFSSTMGACISYS